MCPDWKRYDDITLEDHLTSFGCRTPDQITASHWPICSTKEGMKQARIHLNNNKRRPCRKVESVDIESGESKSIDGSDTTNSDHWFCITIRILNHRFKDTIQQKEVDIQTLIGYIGGYIGILTGFSLIQIPQIMMTISKHVRKCIIDIQWIQIRNYWKTISLKITTLLAFCINSIIEYTIVVLYFFILAATGFSVTNHPTYDKFQSGPNDINTFW